MKEYPRRYEPGTSHAHAVELLRRQAGPAGRAPAPPGAVVLDIGCGHAPVAEPVAGELGLTYVGLDVDRASLADLAERGFEAVHLDLGLPPEQLEAALRAAVGDRPLAAVVALDVLEHLVEPERVVRACEAVAGDPEVDGSPAPCLVVSVPNVSHFDVAARLLLGRWDMTPTGLLDDTHLRFFSHARFQRLFAGTRWREVDAQDTTAIHSDQYFLEASPALAPAAPLRNLLWRLRVGAFPYATTYQFVRCFTRADEAAPPAAPEPGPARPEGAEAPGEPFLTAMVRVVGEADAAGLPAVLADLAGQDDQGFELVVGVGPAPGTDPAPALAAHPDLAARTRVVGIDPAVVSDNVGADMARGRYVSFLEARHRVGPRWVAAFRRGAVEPASGSYSGAVVRLDAVAVDPAELAASAGRPFGDLAAGRPAVDPGSFDPLWEGDLGHPALGAYAVPTSVHRSLGLSFDEHHGGLAATLFLVRSVELAGQRAVSDVQLAAEPAAFERPDLTALRVGMGDAPFIADGGTLARVIELQRRLAGLEARQRELHRELAAAHHRLARYEPVERGARRLAEAVRARQAVALARRAVGRAGAAAEGLRRAWRGPGGA